MSNVSSRELARHFRGELSDVSVLPPAGAPVADDLDLVAMAQASLNYLRGNPDPDRDYECKFALGPLGIPCHYPTSVPPNEYGYDPISIADTDCRMENQYLHMREMVGEAEPDPVELGVRRRVEGYQRGDGLSWANPAAFTGQPIEGLWASTWASGKLLYSLAERYQRSGDERLGEWARRIFLGLRRLASWEGDKAYYPGGPAPWKDGVWLREGWAASHACSYPAIIEPCVRYYQCCGDEEALDFARAFADGFLACIQPGQGDHRIDPETGSFAAHVHLHTHAVWGVAHLGALLGERRYLDYARRVYDFVLGHGTDFGWYPEFAPQSEWRTEICVVGDMVSLSAHLARGGQVELWDHIERTVRNELRRAQFVLTPEFLALFENLHPDRGREEIEHAVAQLRRLEGGFVAQPTFDDWVSYPETLGQPGLSQNGIHMMGCCPPTGMQGLWEAWSGAVEEREDGICINLGLTRDHPAAQVTAFAPENGRLRVVTRRVGHYLLRPPSWASRAGVRLQVDGEDVSVQWGGAQHAYVRCVGSRPATTLELTWPVPAFTQTFTPTSVPARDDKVHVRWTGNTVREVLPHGKYVRMFE